jgi:hypothetical protein
MISNNNEIRDLRRVKIILMHKLKLGLFKKIKIKSIK